MESVNYLVRKDPSNWFWIPKPRRSARLRLFCFPYAGGAANVFRTWPDLLPHDIELCAIQLPGRGARFRESLLDSMDMILDALQSELESFLMKQQPYAFFGHSMGATIAFELCRRLQKQGQYLPERLIVSGRRAPQLPPEQGRVMIHTLQKVDFFARLRKLNGTPEAVLQHQDLMNLMEPVLRSDFKLIETWQYQDADKLCIPISVCSGDADEHVDAQALLAWAQQTSAECDTFLLPGDHFYLHANEKLLLAYLTERLKREN